MGLFDSFRKEEVTNSKVLVCQVAGADLRPKFDEQVKSDVRVDQRLYAAASSAMFTTVAELRGAVGHQYDILHLFCDVGATGVISDSSGDRISGTELLKTAVESGVKLLWIGNDNPQQAYDTGFKTKGLKINVVLTLTRLGSNTSFFLDNLLTQIAAGETLSKAWNAAANPEGKSVQPDVHRTISCLGLRALS